MFAGNICGEGKGRYGVCDKNLECQHLNSKCGRTLTLKGNTAKWWVGGKWLRSALTCNDRPM